MSGGTTYRPYTMSALRSRRLPPAGERYFRFAARETCLARDEVWMTWLIEHGAKGFIDIPNDRIYDYYIEEESSLRVLRRLALSMVRNWTSYLNKYRRLNNRLPELARGLSDATRHGNTKSVLWRFHQYLQATYDYGEYIWGAWAVIYHLEPELMRKIPQHMGAVLALDQPIEFLKLQRDLSRLSMKQLVQRYGWLNVYNPYDKPYSVRDIQKLHASIKHTEISQQFNTFSQARKSFQQLLQSIKEPMLKRKIEIVHTYAFLKTDRVDVWKKMMLAVAPFYQWLAQQFPGATLHDATNLFAREIVAFLQTGTLPQLSNVKARSKNNALYFIRKGNINVVTNKRRITQILNSLERIGFKGRTINGIIASPGTAEGTARIITHSSDLHKIKPGDVFVAKYTFPSYTPYMRRCVAIVTDEGGLTGHAAVVAREFDIPCIVGTKIATKALKDGDRVEVDANNGTVRKL